MMNGEISRVNNKFTTTINFSDNGVSKNIPLYAQTDDLIAVQSAVRRMITFPVQERLLSELDVEIPAVKFINIRQDLPVEKYFNNGVLNLSLDCAKELRGNLFALALSGGTDKGFGHVGLLLALEKAGMRPDILTCASTGAAFGAPYALHGSAKLVQDMYKSFIKNYSYQDLCDMFFTFKGGLIKGNKVIDAIKKEGDLGESKFNEAKIDLYIISTDLRSGKRILFCNPESANNYFIEDPRTTAKPKYYVQKGDIPIWEGVRASIGIPGLIRPYRLGEYDLSDGGIRENCPIRLAANNFLIGMILGGNLGFSGYLEERFIDKNFSQAPLQAMSIMLWNQLDFLNSPLFKNISVRVGNYGFFNMDTPDGFYYGQHLAVSARDTMEYILRKTCGIDPNENKERADKVNINRFFGKWGIEKANQIRARMDLENLDEAAGYKWNDCKANIYSMIDKNSLIMKYAPKNPKNQVFWNSMLSQDGGKIEPKKTTRSFSGFIFDEARKEFGTIRTLLAGANIAMAKWLLSGKKR